MKYVFYILNIILLTIMHLESKTLLDYKYNKYSQFGEDGIIQKIFSKIKTRSKICIEFGAADGFRLSNTANLWINDKEWKAILIESSIKDYKKLIKNTKPYSNCKTIKAHIEDKGENHLENILIKNNSFYNDIDLLSIDIDSNDYYILSSLQKLKPRVIICEFNPSIPYHLDIYAEYNNNFGCSAGALIRLAKNKNYSLVAMTEVNCIFVLNEELPKLKKFDISFSKILPPRNSFTYIVTNFKGEYRVISGKNKFKWFKLKNEPYKGKILGRYNNYPNMIVKS